MSEGQERKDHWETVYRRRPVEKTSWHQAVPQPSLEMIETAASGPDTAIIDIGAGASPLPEFLLESGFHDITVLDLSAAALEQLKSRLGEQAAQLSWVEADVTRYSPERKFGIWHDRAAFHFLTELWDQQRYVAVLDQSLDSGSQAIIATFSHRGPSKCSGLDIVQYDAARLEARLGPAFRLLEQREFPHYTPGGRKQWFNYFRLLKI